MPLAAAASRRRPWRRPSRAGGAALALDQTAAGRSGGDAPGSCPTACATTSAATAGPANRVSLRLAVNVGSIFEDDDQRGLAHFLEHMAFNGTENFKPGELVSVSRDRSARASVRTSTPTPRSTRPSTCSTCRPTSPGYVDRGLLALHDFAAGMSLLPEEIEKERGVVIEEWRGRLGAGLAADRQAAAGAVRRVALRRAAADRHARDPQVVSAPAPRRLLSQVVSPRSDGGRSSSATSIRPRRSKLVEKRFGAIPAAKTPVATVDRTVPPHKETLFSDRDRSGGAGLVGRDRVQAAGRRSSRRSATIGGR